MGKAGIYCRVSKEEKNVKGENSSSILSQIEIINDYLKAHKNIEKGEVYIDDGYSGADFQRPGFLKMKEDIEGGRIDTVIVKDISRLGREHIDTGFYMEKYFPENRIRFISVLDFYDSRGGDINQEMLQIKTLINDMYMRDISKKVKSVIQMKRARGEYTQGQPPYGYVKSKEKHNHLEVEEYSGDVVKSIYEKYLAGKGYGEIAKELNEAGIVSPAAYKKKLLQVDYPYKVGSGIWSKSAVRDILTNPVYTGGVVDLKRKKISYKLKKQKTIPLSERKIYNGAHKPIVSHEDFMKVQILRRGKQ